jgi:cytochrome c553
VIGIARKSWRPPAFGLAAVLLTAVPAAAQPMSYAERLQACHTCHGDDGNSKMEKIPSIAGQPAFYILNQLFLMREGVRKVEAMEPFVKDLKDDELDRFSKLFAGLPAKPSGEPIDEAKAKRGAEIAEHRRCSSCHLPSLAGQDQMPRLAKQRIDYLIPTLQSYRGAPRPGADTAMSAAIAGASDADIEALAHYCASK